MGKKLAAATVALFSLAGATSVSAAGCKLGKVAELPVTMNGGRPLVSVKVNGVEGRLMADTGAFFSMISPDAAQRFKLKAGELPGNLQVRGVTGEVDVKYTTAASFTVANASLAGVDFLVGGGAGVSEDGLLGANLLTAYDAEFDLGHGMIRLMKAEGCGGKTNLAYWASNVAVGTVPLDQINFPNDKVLGSATVNGVKMRVIFDTGAGRSVLTLAGARKAGVTSNDPGAIPAGLSGGIGRRVVNNWIVPVKSFEIGGEQITNTRLRIADIELDHADMLLGADFFLSHHVFIAKSQQKLYFTYNGGPVFNLSATPQNEELTPESQPTHADGLARQAAARLSRRDVKGAMADYNKAVELTPADPNLLYARGVAEAQTDQLDLALADLDKAISLRPSFAQAVFARGEVRLEKKNPEAARQDITQAIKADESFRLRAARAYAANDMFADAIDQYSQLIANPIASRSDTPHTGSFIGERTEDPRLGDAFAGRCHARALSGQDLKDALDDCNRGVRMSPGDTDVVVDRAYVRLRLGQLDQALSDYASALHDQPKNPWALYGRGLAELRKGAKDAGEADINAAKALRPKVADRGRALGLTP